MGIAVAVIMAMVVAIAVTVDSRGCDTGFECVTLANLYAPCELVWLSWLSVVMKLFINSLNVLLTHLSGLI